MIVSSSPLDPQGHLQVPHNIQIWTSLLSLVSKFWNGNKSWICRLSHVTSRNHSVFTKLTDTFYVASLFLYPLKISENLCFSDIFRRYRKRLAAWNSWREKNNVFTKTVTFSFSKNVRLSQSKFLYQFFINLLIFWNLLYPIISNNIK